jgi:hypothetical protein
MAHTAHVALTSINEQLGAEQIQTGGVLRCIICNGVAKRLLKVEVSQNRADLIRKIDSCISTFYARQS